ncbi:hypothetical protein BURPS668_2119 [Burkholderia pseudomallei 668]|nr:hypothetical protein BURPS668_2119 [Burkholderia pseudomallei 668]
MPRARRGRRDGSVAPRSRMARRLPVRRRPTPPMHARRPKKSPGG